MTKPLLSSTALAVLLAVPATAAAQSAPSSNAGASSCPPGSWFCAEAPQQQASPADQPMPLQPLPDSDDAHSSSPGVTYEPAPKSPPPVVVYQPPPETAVARPETPPPYEYAPPPHEPLSRPREWGLNLHLEGATIGHGSGGGSSMGGAGAGLRFKPMRTFGIEADLDFVGGRDWQGENRTETAFTINGLLFLNPRSHAQVYLLGGFGWSGAHVRCDLSMATECPGGQVDQHFGYFGAQVGVGLELRLTRSLAFNADLRGFMRGRTDNLAASQPEFTDANGRTTNTSGGGLLTGGMTLYF
jgi:opacity protein-like surface antigen